MEDVRGNHSFAKNPSKNQRKHKKNKRKIEHNAESIKNNVFVGPSYSNDEIKSFLDINKIHYKFLETNSLLETTAKLISEDNVVGWYQGKFTVRMDPEAAEEMLVRFTTQSRRKV